MNVLIVQCDAAITDVARITCLRDLEDYLENPTIKGLGGTDFRPVFTYVDEAMATGELNDLGGLIYFTDGQGTYPARPRLRNRLCVPRFRRCRSLGPRAALGHESDPG